MDTKQLVDTIKAEKKVKFKSAFYLLFNRILNYSKIDEETSFASNSYELYLLVTLDKILSMVIFRLLYASLDCFSEKNTLQTPLFFT